MGILRIVLGAAVLAYALAGAAAAGSIAAVRFGVLSPPSVAPALGDLIGAASGLQLALWAVAVALYLVTAIKLLRRVKTFNTWAAAFVLDVVNWLWFRAAGYYEAAIPANLVYADYVVLGANLLVGVLILLLGRTHLD